jgi:adenylate cyclase
MERRLAAILAADVVGYSRLIEADEAGTLAALKSHRGTLIEPKIAQYHGRIVKLMGDGLLAEFPSAVEAVHCAVEIQYAMAERNGYVPEERRITYRVGINIGDIVVEDDDIFGDGVNIAARLEGLADPGGICISRPVHTQIVDKLDLTFEDLGEQQVKNIAKPVMVYRVALDTKAAALITPVVQGIARSKHRRWLVAGAAAALLVLAVGGALWWQPWAPDMEPASVERMALPLPDKPSIAVLPFDNLSGDPDQEPLSDGITEDIITELSRFRELFVIARHSTQTYKGKPVKVQKVAEDLGVRYVLEGSIRKTGNQIRINAQLIDATSGRHIWAERYDRDLSDLFSIQASQRKVSRPTTISCADATFSSKKASGGLRSTSRRAASTKRRRRSTLSSRVPTSSWHGRISTTSYTDGAPCPKNRVRGLWSLPSRQSRWIRPMRGHTMRWALFSSTNGNTTGPLRRSRKQSL